MGIKDYVLIFMTILEKPLLPKIAVVLLFLCHIISVFSVLLWPPGTFYNFPLKARTCQHMLSHGSLISGNVLKQTMWDRLSRIIDRCSYNPDIIVEEYMSKNGLKIFHIPNRNRLISEKSCSILSINNVMHSDAEQRLEVMNNSQLFEGTPRSNYLQDSTPCDLYASDKSIESPASYQAKAASFKVDLEQKPHSRESNVTDLRSLITIFGIETVDNLIVGPFEHNLEFEGLLRPETYKRLGSRFCQVNMIYQHTDIVSRAPFLHSFHQILYQRTFFIIRTSKSVDNRYMNVYSINFDEDYCAERYYKPTYEFKRRV